MISINECWLSTRSVDHHQQVLINNNNNENWWLIANHANYVLGKKLFRKNNPPGACHENHENLQAGPALCWSAVTDLHTESGLQRIGTPAASDSRELVDGELQNNICLFLKINAFLCCADCLHDLFCGKGWKWLDFYWQFLVFTDDSDNCRLWISSKVDTWKGEKIFYFSHSIIFNILFVPARWRNVCPTWSFYPDTSSSHCG